MNKETLLIVEDNTVLREGLREMLSLEGFNVVAAANGRQALEKMNAVMPDLILSDIAMPEMGGVEFFQAVRNRADWTAIPFLFLTARGEPEDVLAGKGLGAEDYLIKPLSRDELVSAVRARLARSRQLLMVQLQQAYETSLTVLANAIEVRDHYTRGHVERVMAYVVALAEELGWSGARLEQLRFGSILHDIGKIMTPDTILSKPGKLNQEELEIIKKHPVTGAEIIKDISYLETAIPVVRYHHERWDGKGYPEGLAEEAIPMPARVIAVADTFDAMTTDRPYHPALPAEVAYEDIVKCSGSQYDPAVVAAFQRCWEAGRFQAILKQWMSTNGSG